MLSLLCNDYSTTFQFVVQVSSVTCADLYSALGLSVITADAMCLFPVRLNCFADVRITDVAVAGGPNRWL
jgi:hypothetical protein